MDPFHISGFSVAEVIMVGMHHQSVKRIHITGRWVWSELNSTGLWITVEKCCCSLHSVGSLVQGKQQSKVSLLSSWQWMLVLCKSVALFIFWLKSNITSNWMVHGQNCNQRHTAHVLKQAMCQKAQIALLMQDACNFPVILKLVQVCLIKVV